MKLDRLILKPISAILKTEFKEYVLALEQSKELLFNKESSWKPSSVVVKFRGYMCLKICALLFENICRNTCR